MGVRPSDPLLSYQFAIEVSGSFTATGYFTEVSGVGAEHEVTEHKVVDHENGGKELVQQIPGRIKWNEITFKKGLTTNTAFWEWHEYVVNGDTEGVRSEVTLKMFDRSYTEAASWVFINAWPSKLSGPEMKADSSDFTVEEMTLVHEGLYRADYGAEDSGIPIRSNDVA